MTERIDIDDAAAAWVAREDRGLLDAAELARRDAWLAAEVRHRGAYARAHAVFLHAQRAGALGHGFDDQPVARHSGGRRLARWVSLAAAAVLVFAVMGLRPTPSEFGAIDYRTGLGEVLRVPLSDGSVLTLNSGTTVRVHYDRNQRLVMLLRGEALVKVRKDPERPFVVKAGSTDVVAVGTSFSVRRESGNAFKVLVSEGIVDIRNPDTQLEPVRVHANYAAVSLRGTDVRVAPLASEAMHRRLAWRDGMLSFEGDTLADAAMEFSRYSDLRIRIDDPAVASRRVVGVYTATDPAGFANAVASSLGLRVEVSGDGVVLRAGE